MTQLEQFRKETKEWLDQNCPPSMRSGADPSIPVDEVWGGRKAEYKNPESKIWLDRMGAKGWTMPSVPKEYGGGGLNAEEISILNQEMFAIGAKGPLLSFGIWNFFLRVSVVLKDLFVVSHVTRYFDLIFLWFLTSCAQTVFADAPESTSTCTI